MLNLVNGTLWFSKWDAAVNETLDLVNGILNLVNMTLQFSNGIC